MQNFEINKQNNFVDFKNIVKFFITWLLRSRAMMFWTMLVPIAITVLMTCVVKQPTTQVSFFLIGVLLSMFMITVNVGPGVIANLRISNSFVQFKIAGYRERIVLGAISFVFLLITWITIFISLIIILIIQQGVGFLQSANIVTHISTGQAILHLLFFFFVMMLASIAFMPLCWFFASISHDPKTIQMVSTIIFMLALTLAGVYYPYQINPTLHTGGAKIIIDFLYILPFGAIRNLLALSLGMSNPTTGHYAWSMGVNDQPWMIAVEIISLCLTFIIFAYSAKWYFKFNN